MTLDNDQRAVLALWFIVNASLSSYYKLITYFKTPLIALNANMDDWQKLGIHKAHLARFSDKPSARAFVRQVEISVHKGIYGLTFIVPNALTELYDPPPVLFYKGDIDRLVQPSLAIVGTRYPSDYAKKITFDMAQYLAQAGFVVVSGLAKGVDNYAHQGALAQQETALLGATVGVMGTGIDICYPSEHQGLFFDIIEAGGCLISELLPGTPASRYNFPRRNRLIVGLAAATIVTEANIQSGSLLSARLAAEQGKQVFVVPNRIDSLTGEGCHYLIREGATLIYHPSQILEELGTLSTNKYDTTALPSLNIFANHITKRTDMIQNATAAKQPDNSLDKQIMPYQQSHKQTVNKQSTPDISKKNATSMALSVSVPEDLADTLAFLNDKPQDLDSLVAISGTTVPMLLANLTQLEILGVVVQQGGRYAKA